MSAMSPRPRNPFPQNITEAAAAAIASDPRVVRVEADQVMTAIASQSPATWGLDRVDQRTLPGDNTYIYNNDGSNVTVYIIDTGINFTHTDFGGRASKGIDEVTSGGSAADCNGHGTHVSGTVGGATYGIAKNVTLVAVRVLNCQGSGTTSGVIAGIDWVTANRVLPAAANMSLGGGFSATLNQAVARSTAAGVTYAVAAGNSAANACNSSPSSEPSAITVGATDSNDGFAYFSIQFEHRDQHHQRNFDGISARCWRRGALPVSESVRDSRGGFSSARKQRYIGRDQRRSERDCQSPSLHRLYRRRLAATASTAAGPHCELHHVLLGFDLHFHQYFGQHQCIDDVCLEFWRRINERSDKSDSHFRHSSFVYGDADCN